MTPAYSSSAYSAEFPCLKWHYMVFRPLSYRIESYTVKHTFLYLYTFSASDMDFFAAAGATDPDGAPFFFISVSALRR